MSKIEICNYKGSSICSLSFTSCKEGLPLCTKEDVKKTNAENGSPDPKAYEGDVQSFKIWWKNNSWITPFIIPGTIFLIGFLFICCCTCLACFDDCSFKKCFRCLSKDSNKSDSKGSKPIVNSSTTTKLTKQTKITKITIIATQSSQST